METSQLRSRTDSDDGLRLLLVDDDPSFLDITSRHFELYGEDFEIETCVGPREALELLERRDFDGIVSDYRMPGMNGIELLKEVRADYPDLPFVLLTSEGSEEVASEALRNDVTDYVKKGDGSYELMVKRVTNAVLKENAERELKRSEQRYRTLVKNFPGAVTLHDENLVYLLAEGRVFDHIALDPEEMEGKAVRELLPPDTAEELVPMYEAVFDGESLTREIEFAGDTFRVWTVPIRDENGTVFAGLAMSQKITGLKRTEARYEALLENFPDGAIVLFDEDLRYDLVRGEAARSRGRSIEYVEGRTVDELYPPEIARVLTEHYEATLDGEKRTFELDYHGQHYHVVSVPVRQGNEITSGLAISRDITELKTRERELEESEARYRSLTDDVLDTSDVGTLILDSGFDIVWMNEAVEEYLDLGREEVVGRDKREIIAERIAGTLERPEEFVERVTAAYDDNTYTDEFECHVLPGEGREERWLRHWSQPIGSGLYAGGRIEHYTDITEQKRLERQLEEAVERTERQYQTLIDNVPGIVFRNRAGDDWPMEFVSEGCEELTGYTRDELENEVRWERRVIHPDERGEVFDRAVRALEEDGRFEDTYRIVTKDGEVKWVNERAEAVYEDGDLVAAEGIVIDVTVQKNLEEFSSMATHDIRIPLANAQGHLNLAKETNGEEELEKLGRALSSISSILDDIETVTRSPDDLERETVHLEEVVREVLYGRDVELDVEDVEVRGSRSSLTRLVSNLVDNSIEHNDEPVTIRAGPLEDGFYYEDTGQGISEDTRDQMMKKGVTTSEAGYGLGLYIIGKIVDMHDWRMEITESAEGGARFEFFTS